MRLHTSIHKLPFSIFIDVIVNNDLRLLIIEGEPTDEQLSETWQNIITEYASAISTKEVSIKVDGLTELMQLETIIKIIDSMLRVIKMYPRKETFDLLYLFNYPIPKKEYSEANLKAILPTFLAHYKLDKHKYQILAEAKEKELKKKGEGNKFTYEYFNDMISEIGINFNINLDISTIMTGVFCSYMSKLQKHIESKNKLALKQKNK